MKSERTKSTHNGKQNEFFKIALIPRAVDKFPFYASTFSVSFVVTFATSSFCFGFAHLSFGVHLLICVTAGIARKLTKLN